MIGIAKVALDARDEAKLRSALTDLTLKLNDVSISALASTERAMALQNTIRDLEDEARRLKLEATERERYALTEIRPGALAYKSKHVDGRQDEPTHYLCQPCYDKGVKAMLRYTAPVQGGEGKWLCPEGGAPHTIVHTGTRLPYPEVRTARSDFP